MQSNKIHKVFFMIELNPSRMLARHVSDLNGPSSGAFYKLYLQIWYVVIRVLQHIPNLHIQLVKNAPEDGPLRSETCRANISAE